jgi:hypothetical protein
MKVVCLLENPKTSAQGKYSPVEILLRDFNATGPWIDFNKQP